MSKSVGPDPHAPGFPFSPLWWQCCISFPDEADKLVLGREGGLYFDYLESSLGFGEIAPGRRNFRTVLEPGVRETQVFASQHLHSARIPVVMTRAESDGVDVATEIFVAVPDAQGERKPALVRAGGEDPVTRQGGPSVPRVRRGFVQGANIAPEFRDAAWGAEGTAVIYELRVEPGARCTAVLGFAEGTHKDAGRRILRVQLDGADGRTVDPAGAFGAARPGLLRLAARDHDHDGIIRLTVAAADGSPDRDAFLSALWFFAGDPPSDDAILRGAVQPLAFADCGRAPLPRRRLFVRISLANKTPRPVERTPVVRLCTLERVMLRDGELQVGPFTKVRGGFQRLLSDRNALVAELPTQTLAPGATVHLDLAVDRHGYEAPAPDDALFRAARACALDWWSHADLPYEVLEVPDRRIQDLIDSSVRNIYQARDITGSGLPAFHVGPTCYRLLYIVDGAFLLETVALLGRASDARAGLEYILAFQKEDGGFELKEKYWKETGIVLWIATRYARLTGDHAWLRGVWPRIVKAVDFITRLRGCGEAADPASPMHRLAPHGDIDGGIGCNLGAHEQFPEFSNTYWLLAGLKAAAEAARWLGEAETAGAWSAAFEDMRRVFLETASAHLRRDAQGNRYLPIRLGADDSPQKGQWAFCHAVHPGTVFAPDEPFVQGMLAMLDAAKVEGMVCDTGWIYYGLWTYFASFMGHAHLWTGDAAGALADLEALADHAAPVLVWREEQKALGAGDEHGDMPHNWASAEFIRLAFHLVAFERGDELHLFHGVPAHWLRDGAVTAVRGAATAFGPLHASLRREGRDVLVEVAPLQRACTALVVHRSAWAPGSEPLRFDATQHVSLRIAGAC